MENKKNIKWPAILNESPLHAAKCKKSLSDGVQCVVITDSIRIYTYATESIEKTAKLECNPDEKEGYEKYFATIRISPKQQMDAIRPIVTPPFNQEIDSKKITITDVPDDVRAFCLYIDFGLKEEANEPKRPIKVIMHDGDSVKKD